MLKLKKIMMKNFMSVGQVAQVVDLEQNGLTLILGENLDTTGDPNSSRNGAGKTTILNAIFFALFSWPLTPIKKDNLVNKVNHKGMVVVLEFEKDGVQYRIERGRKPTFTRWYIGDIEHNEDEAQGDSKKTNEEILKVIGVGPILAKHILALNTYTTPFLNMTAKDQREVIEELLGITALSQKADKLKVLLNGDKNTGEEGTKDRIKSEEYRLDALAKANERMEKMVEELEKRQKLWDRERTKRVDKLTVEIDKMSHIDIDAELANHEKKAKSKEIIGHINALNKEIDNIHNLETLKSDWDKELSTKLSTLESALAELSKIDIESELAAHEANAQHIEVTAKVKQLEKDLLQKMKIQKKTVQLLEKDENDLKHAEEHNCPTCGQEMHDEKVDVLIESLTESVAKHKAEHEKEMAEIKAIEKELQDNHEVLEGIQVTETFYGSLQDAYNHKTTLTQFEKDIQRENDAKNPYTDQLANYPTTIKEIGEMLASLQTEYDALGDMNTRYATVEEAYNHRAVYEKLQSDKTRETETVNPYIEQIEDTKNAIQPLDKEYLEELYDLREHQQTLLKLLTDKNSFIRKRIIDQNLSFLNHRLEHYIGKLGLPHQVKFLNDLSVEITNLGQEYDAGNLSRGENNRLILSLSWAFRDIWESMNTSINMMFVDELLDSGMDGSGLEAAIEILKSDARNRAKNVFLISHREELKGRVNNTMMVQKENGFTTFINDIDDF